MPAGINQQPPKNANRVRGVLMPHADRLTSSKINIRLHFAAPSYASRSCAPVSGRAISALRADGEKAVIAGLSPKFAALSRPIRVAKTDNPLFHVRHSFLIDRAVIVAQQLNRAKRFCATETHNTFNRAPLAYRPRRRLFRRYGSQSPSRAA